MLRPPRVAIAPLLVACVLFVGGCQQAQPAASPTAPPAAAAGAAAPTSAAAAAPTSAAAAKPSAAASPGGAVGSPVAAASPASSGAVASPVAAAAAPPTVVPFTGQPTSLKASYSNPIATNLPEWMALETGAFQEYGLNVDLSNIASATGIPALLSGEIQVAHLGGSESISAAVQGGDLVIIGVTGPVYPFVFMASASITTVDELRGKKIGVSNVGSSSDIATRVMLRKVGLDPEKDVTIVPVGSLQNRTAALLSGAIDGGLAQPPEQLALQDKGLHILYDMAAQHLAAATDTVVVQRTWLNANRSVAQRYVDALVLGAARAHADKPRTIAVLSKYLNTDDQRALETTYDFFVGQVMPVYPLPQASDFSDALEQLSATNDKVKGFDVSTILDASLVQSSMDRKVGGQ